MIVNVGVVLIAGALVVLLRTSNSPPDPNDPNDVGTLQPQVMRRNLKRASDVANNRVDSGEISEKEAKDFVSDEAETILKNLKAETAPEGDLWEYGEVLITAKEYRKAIPVLEKAVEVAKTEDRRINDSLRLAQCYAAIQEIDKAIATTRKTFNAGPKDSAPLLLAINKDIVPLAKGHGKDEELAKLIEDAIPIYEKTEVDPATEAGRNFLIARPFHVREAKKLIEELRSKRA